jgi:hypothetical protein
LEQVDLTEAEFVTGTQPGDVLKIDEALKVLAQMDSRMSRMIECVFSAVSPWRKQQKF